ncbi:MAG TPA: helix-hairpin-helix domain-containing protein [bacterium]|nr:helix-hairpin-helix domain-containing protein [bacterium]HPN33837.1 helix-hairpin-helix domain-containing protein [bacterium]
MLSLSKKEEKFLLFFLPLFLLGCALQFYRKTIADKVRVDWRAEQTAALRALQTPVQTSAATALGEQKQRLLSGKININQATESEIARLPRIGPVLALRIVSYRREHGSFQSTKDLLKVKGIGKKTLMKIEPYLAIE